MLLAARAWWLRQAARTAIGTGEFLRGFELAAKAQEVQNTLSGQALRRIGEWLGEKPAGWRS
jgi:hypothetical protein